MDNTINKQGGRYVGEGTYGCVFTPPLKCKSGKTIKNAKKPFKNNEAIGKVFENGDEESIQFEIKTAKFFKQLDPNNEFTVPYYGRCITDSDVADRSDGIENCTIIQENPYNVSQLIYANGGDDLDIVIDNIHGKYKDLKFDRFVMLFKPIMKGLLKLNKRGYAHADIKPNNLVYSKKDGLVKMIDFGLMKLLKQLNHNHILKFHSPFQPPEANILYYISIGVINELQIYEHVMKNFNSYNYISMVNFLEFAKYDEKLREFIKVAVAMNIADLSKHFNSIFVNKYDIYSLGMSFVDIVYHLRADNGLNIIDDNLFTAFIKSVVVPMIDPNPYNRVGILECYMNMEMFYNQYSGKKAAFDSEFFAKFVNINDLRAMLKKYKRPIYGNKKMLYDRVLSIKLQTNIKQRVV